MSFVSDSSQLATAGPEKNYSKFYIQQRNFVIGAKDISGILKL